MNGEEFFLLMQLNRLKDRFQGSAAKAIIEVVGCEKDEKMQGYIGKVLYKFNNVVKMMDGCLGIYAWEEYEELFHDKYINILLERLNFLYVCTRNENFLQLFSQVYWKCTQEFILELWRELPEGESIHNNESDFVKIFEDFFNETIRVFPEFIEKELKEFHNLYRASRYEVYDNYKYILPDPNYCKDNRWNEDGIAYLYLSYDNKGSLVQNLMQAKRTCFEELRAKEFEELSVCMFEPVCAGAKILDLSYDDIEYDLEIKKIGSLEEVYVDRIFEEINSDVKLRKRILRCVQEKDRKAFNDEMEVLQKKLGIGEAAHKFIQLQLSKVLIGNICEAIFYAVDKDDDPNLEAYIPFRAFSRYLINKGFRGVAYKSTRMEKAGLRGKCLVLFEPEDATYVRGEMEVYEYHKEECRLIKKY